MAAQKCFVFDFHWRRARTRTPRILGRLGGCRGWMNVRGGKAIALRSLQHVVDPTRFSKLIECSVDLGLQAIVIPLPAFNCGFTRTYVCVCVCACPCACGNVSFRLQVSSSIRSSITLAVTSRAEIRATSSELPLPSLSLVPSSVARTRHRL